MNVLRPDDGDEDDEGGYDSDEDTLNLISNQSTFNKRKYKK